MGFVRRFTSWFDGRRRLVLVVFGAWVLIAAASAGAAPGDAGWVGVPDLSSVLTVIFALILLLGIALHIYLMGGERPPREGERRKLSSLWLGALVFFGLLMLARAIPRDAEGPVGAEEVEFAEDTEQPELTRTDRLDAVDDRRRVGGWEVATAAAVAAAAAGLLLWLRRSNPVTAVPTRSVSASVAPAIDQAIADLDLGEDPRTAVLRAYAALEQALTSHGLPRRGHETAAEHLRRALRTVPVDQDDVAELGILYERARFSADAASISDRDRARTILDQARSDIRRTETSASEGSR